MPSASSTAAPLASTSTTRPRTIAPLGIPGQIAGERVLVDLLHPERDAFALRVHAEHHGLELVALPEAPDGFLARLVPGKIGQVHEAVDAAFESHEDPEIGDRLDGAGHVVTLAVVRPRSPPRGSACTA